MTTTQPPSSATEAAPADPSNPMILSDMVDTALETAANQTRAARLATALKNGLADEYDMDSPLTIEIVPSDAETAHPNGPHLSAV